MSFPQNNEPYFGGQQGGEDGNTPGAPGAGQGQMAQSMEGAPGQYPVNNMPVGAPGATGGDQHSSDNKTTLWYAELSSTNVIKLIAIVGWVSLSLGLTRTSFA